MKVMHSRVLNRHGNIFGITSTTRINVVNGRSLILSYYSREIWLMLLLNLHGKRSGSVTSVRTRLSPLTYLVKGRAKQTAAPGKCEAAMLLNRA